MKIVFVMNVFDEPFEQVDGTAKALREHYPEATIFILYDGMPMYGIEYGCIERRLEHTKVNGKYGLWTQRYLEIALKIPDVDIIFKVDPDTTVLNSMESLPNPNDEVLFCRFRKDLVPHGGAIGYTRKMAEKLVRSGWLIDEKLLWMFKYSFWQDQMMKHICLTQKIVVQNRPDFVVAGEETELTSFSHHK